MANPAANRGANALMMSAPCVTWLAVSCILPPSCECTIPWIGAVVTGRADSSPGQHLDGSADEQSRHPQVLDRVCDVKAVTFPGVREAADGSAWGNYSHSFDCQH